MEFMTILMATFKDGTPTKKAMYTVESSDLAISGVHKYMGSYMAQSNVASVACLAVNTIGGVYKNEHWTAPTPTPTPETDAEVEGGDAE